MLTNCLPKFSGLADDPIAMSLDRRLFLRKASVASIAVGASSLSPAHPNALGLNRPANNQDDADSDTVFQDPLPGEGLIEYVQRTQGHWDEQVYKHLLGAANEFKEGDAIVGVAAIHEPHRQLARQLLTNTRLHEIDAHPPHRDLLLVAINDCLDVDAHQASREWTVGELKQFLMDQSEEEILSRASGLSSDVIGCVVKIMTNQELKALGAKVFNPLPGSQIGAKGYLGARIQPNSPTDHSEDIRWQVFCGWSYAVGDVLLGTNPVSSEVASVAAVEATLQDILQTFGLTQILPHCVLSHIDVQVEVERQNPGSTALWFQSIAGSDTANATFDISLEKMLRYAQIKGGPFGLYFETGQGADFTNGHSHGFDMVLHESRKYGFARLLSKRYAEANRRSLQAPAGNGQASIRPWVHLNDVAGFIGPEVFRTREQLVRCCLEDIVMGKLHGLCIGLDVCSTLHMDVSLDDLDWCLDQLATAGPAYLMALPTKIDPMLGYLTTGYQDHVRLREKYGLRVNDAMWDFFKRLEVIDASGKPTEHFGDPLWVYLKYRRARNDLRSDAEILAEGKLQMEAVKRRGVFLSSGYGESPSELRSDLETDIRRIYQDAKQSIWAELDPDMEEVIAPAIVISSQSNARENYILHPASGEQLSESSIEEIKQLRVLHAGRYDLQIMVSDGLNALAIADQDQLLPFLSQLRSRLSQEGFQVAPETVLIRSGRVRAGYQVGELLFGGQDSQRAIIHVIGERPGTGHRTFSAYFTACHGSVWGNAGSVDHDQTRVVAGIANTALLPGNAAEDVVRILCQMWEGSQTP